MKTDIILHETNELLNNCGQAHLTAFYSELDAQQKDNLLSQIDKLDFDSLPGWIDEYVKNGHPMEVPVEFSPAPSFAPAADSDQQKEIYRKARDLGIEIISSGKVAGFVVAGGQGTRLGFDGPKGNYPISPIKNKTLFQIFAEGIGAASKKYQTTIPWYVMTSPLNHEPTVEIFESAGYYGLNKQDVIIFQQGTMPNFAFDGKILLAEKGKLATSPDGHGGSLKALKDSGALDDMKKRGIEHISYWQVDNPLINVCDPLFIGLHAMEKAGMSSKALKKVDPLEKVGNFCFAGGKVTVIEYSDLPDEYAQRTDADGSLTFELGSIGIHVISVDFVEEINEGTFSLPFHRAVKKIPHIDPQGNFIRPDEPNGVKLETFIFDAIPLADRSVILQTLRSEEFAPVKNATGTDSAEVTRIMMIERASNWLESVGIEIPRKSNGQPDCVIEISPAFALCAEDIAAKRDSIPPITPGSKIYID